MIFRYYLDGTLINEPKGWDSLTTTIKRDREKKTVMRSQDVTLKFSGDAYDYLLAKFNAGFNTEVDIEITKSTDDGLTFSLFFRGILFVKYFEVDEKKKIISTKIEDNSFFARINNNRSLECYPFSGFSKNSDPLNPIPIDIAPVQFISFFNPADGTYYPILTGTDKERSCAAYRVYDIFKFLIAFMSDGQVEFDSSLFGDDGERAGMMLTTGVVIGTVQAGLSIEGFERNFNKINFEEVFNEVNRICNIGVFIESQFGAAPVVRIEKWDDTFEDTELAVLSNIDEIKTTIYQDQLYSKMSLGTSQNLISYDSQSGGDFPETIDFLGCKEETFNILGTSNIDRALDLTGNYIVSSNIIADGVVNQSDQWDDNFVFVDCVFDSGTTWIAVQTNTITGSTPPFYYNQAFFNDQITLRYLKHIPNNIAVQLGNYDYRFHATKTGTTAFSQSGIIPAVPFEDDSTSPNFDNNGNYNNSIYRFTLTQSGGYTFFVRLNILFAWTANPLVLTREENKFYLFVSKYDSADNNLGDFIVDLGTVSPPAGQQISFQMAGSATINGVATDYMTVRLVSMTTDAPTSANRLVSFTAIIAGSEFACTATQTGGGVYQTYDPNDYSVYMHKFKTILNDTDRNAIEANVKGYLTFSRFNEPQRRGWIEEVKIKDRSGEADIILNSSKKTNN